MEPARRQTSSNNDLFCHFLLFSRASFHIEEKRQGETIWISSFKKKNLQGRVIVHILETRTTFDLQRVSHISLADRTHYQLGQSIESLGEDLKRQRETTGQLLAVLQKSKQPRTEEAAVHKSSAVLVYRQVCNVSFRIVQKWSLALRLYLSKYIRHSGFHGSSTAAVSAV